MSDLVERLRARKEPNIEYDLHYPQIVDSDTPDAECLEAAARIAQLEAALHRISLGSQDSGTTKKDLGREARAALEDRT